MSEYVMKYLVSEARLSDRFYIDSAATSREEIGNPVHPGTQRKLREVGIPCGGHRARQMRREEYEEFDYLIGMDSWNIRNIEPDHRKWRSGGQGMPASGFYRPGKGRTLPTHGTRVILMQPTGM